MKILKGTMDIFLLILLFLMHYLVSKLVNNLLYAIFIDKGSLVTSFPDLAGNYVPDIHLRLLEINYCVRLMVELV